MSQESTPTQNLSHLDKMFLSCKQCSLPSPSSHLVTDSCDSPPGRAVEQQTPRRNSVLRSISCRPWHPSYPGICQQRICYRSLSYCLGQQCQDYTEFPRASLLGRSSRPCKRCSFARSLILQLQSSSDGPLGRAVEKMHPLRSSAQEHSSCRLLLQFYPGMIRARTEDIRPVPQYLQMSQLGSFPL